MGGSASQNPVTLHLRQHKAHTLFPPNAVPASSYQRWHLRCRCLPPWTWWWGIDCTTHWTSLVMSSLQRVLTIHFLTLTCWFWQPAAEFLLKDIMLYGYGKSVLGLDTEFYKKPAQFLYIYCREQKHKVKCLQTVITMPHYFCGKYLCFNCQNLVSRTDCNYAFLLMLAYERTKLHLFTLFKHNTISWFYQFCPRL